jgi:hypothetical protein
MASLTQWNVDEWCTVRQAREERASRKRTWIAAMTQKLRASATIVEATAAASPSVRLVSTEGMPMELLWDQPGPG